ncbi:hypothetical protein SNEBB_010693 [Seison nebaliae]|nr:hypothetical protein SNEBB_010693 [Seison nebaliae]
MLRLFTFLLYFQYLSAVEFLERPTDQLILLGESAIIPCKIKGDHGFVFWVHNDKVVLIIVAYQGQKFSTSHVELSGNTTAGDYSIRIKKVQWDDEGKISCQIRSKPIATADAKLEVAVKPSSPFLQQIEPLPSQGLMNDGFSSTKFSFGQQNIQLKCTVKKTRPKVIFRWHLDDKEMDLNMKLLSENTKHINISSEDKVGNNKDFSMFTSQSILTIHSIDKEMKKYLNSKYISCYINHPYYDSKGYSSKSEIVSNAIQVEIEDPPQSIELFMRRSNGNMINEKNKNQKIFDQLISGDSLTFRCVVKGGLPKPKIQWFRNNHQISDTRQDSSRLFDDKMESIIKIDRLNKMDNGANYSCITFNDATRRLPQKYLRSTSINLDIHYKVDELQLVGGEKFNVQKIYGKKNTKIQISCNTTVGYPPPKLIWKIITVDGEDGTGLISENFQLIGPSATDKYWPKDGLKAVSTISIPLIEKLDSAVVTCREEDSELSISKQIEIWTKPNHLELRQVNSDNHLIVGASAEFSCNAYGGNPRPTFEWRQNGILIENPELLSYKASMGLTQSILNFKPTQLDHTTEISCKVFQKRIFPNHFLRQSHILNIYFPATFVQLEAPNIQMVADTIYTFKCETSAANPSPSIIWLLDGEPLTYVSGATSEISYKNQTGAAKSELNFEVKQDLNGHILECRQDPEEYIMKVKPDENIQTETKRSQLKLNIHFSPILTKTQNELLTRIYAKEQLDEVQTISLENVIESNPWPNDIRIKSVTGDDLIDRENFEFTSKGLIIHRASRDIAGMYEMEMTNTIGTLIFQFELIIRYGAEIIDFKTDRQHYREHENAILACVVDGLPLHIEENVKFYKSYGMDMIPIEVNSENSKKYLLLMDNLSNNKKRVTLKINSLSINDIANYYCVVNNTIGSMRKNVSLFLETRPQSYEPGMLLKKVAHNVEVEGNRKILRCIGRGNPKPSFSWSKLTIPINKLSEQERRRITIKTDLFTEKNKGKNDSLIPWYLSELIIDDIRRTTDYAKYECQIKNFVDHKIITYELNSLTKPDSILTLRTSNMTSTSIKLSWIPGYDGGMSQQFLVEYKLLGKHKYVIGENSRRILSSDQNQINLKKLRPNSQYRISVISRNDLGECSSNNKNTLIIRTAPSNSQSEFLPNPLSLLNKFKLSDPHKYFEEKHEISRTSRFILIFCSVGLIILTLNVIVVALLVRYRRKKQRAKYERKKRSQIQKQLSQKMTENRLQRQCPDHSLFQYSFSDRQSSSLRSTLVAKSSDSNTSQSNDIKCNQSLTPPESISTKTMELRVTPPLSINKDDKNDIYNRQVNLIDLQKSSIILPPHADNESLYNDSGSSSQISGNSQLQVKTKCIKNDSITFNRKFDSNDNGSNGIESDTASNKPFLRLNNSQENDKYCSLAKVNRLMLQESPGEKRRRSVAYSSFNSNQSGLYHATPTMVKHLENSNMTFSMIDENNNNNNNINNTNSLYEKLRLKLTNSPNINSNDHPPSSNHNHSLSFGKSNDQELSSHSMRPATFVCKELSESDNSYKPLASISRNGHPIMKNSNVINSMNRSSNVTSMPIPEEYSTYHQYNRFCPEYIPTKQEINEMEYAESLRNLQKSVQDDLDIDPNNSQESLMRQQMLESGNSSGHSTKSSQIVDSSEEESNDVKNHRNDMVNL